MAGKVPDVGLVVFVQSDIDNVLDGALLHIYGGGHVPAFGDTLALYLAAEINGGAGWATSVGIIDWGAVAVDVAHVARSSAGVYTFLYDGANPAPPVGVSGIFVTDIGITELLYAEKFVTGDVVLTNVNDPVSYQPRWGDVSRF